jgi:hypothetical protein
MRDDDDDFGRDDIAGFRGILAGLALTFLMGVIAWALMQAFLWLRS